MRPSSIVIIVSKGVAITQHIFSFFSSGLEFIADEQVISKALTILYIISTILRHSKFLQR